MNENIRKLQLNLNYEFKDKNLITQALTHKSFKQPYDNERLEFLGDAVLDLVVGEYLFLKFKKADEGNLSKIRAALVNENGFEKLAKYINLGECLFMSSAEENNGGREKASILSNAFEAVMGTIYLESGLDVVRKITIELIEKNYKDISLDSLFRDFKTTLQEITQARYGEIPEYEVVASRGPDHLKEFEISLKLQGKELTRAVGKSKKIAQQNAAQIAIRILNNE